MQSGPDSQDRRQLLQLLLASGTAPLFLRHARAADLERFGLGLASGCPRPDSLVLWTRLTGPGLAEPVPVRWELAEDEGFQRLAASGTELAEADSAFTVHAEPGGLKPDRWYWYRFSALGQRSSTGRTRTSPAPDAQASLRFAIASCQRWDHGRYAAWRDMAEQELDLVLFLGDYIYEYSTAHDSDAQRRHQGGPCRTLDDYRQRYAQYKSDPHLQRMHARAPWICTWDDHEVSNDWAGDQPEVPDAGFHARRAAATQAYWEHMPFPKAWRPRDPDRAAIRLYHHWDWGQLARIITTDDRSWRDPQVCPKPGRGGSNTVDERDCPALNQSGRTLLGEAQERWLARTWDASRPWNLLAQQTLMARHTLRDTAKGGGRYWTDGWDGYPAARARLLKDLAGAQVPNAVVLGGDVHTNYVAGLRLDFDRPETPLLASEFCGTSISSHGGSQDKQNQALAWNPHVLHSRTDQRGYMRFELAEGLMNAELRTVQSHWDEASAIEVQARFVVESGKPGPQRA
ncbi:alkaline phosphatase D family protein [Pelomonas sp. SE-A7]|uniref:alkaline phosphatase D family protein n=1 Tax=Pelomonas sp. SE-A7 TaxID=3054953 RepID=UPI00259D0DED|nr:alkaline phosphatase D family protein [Pelomonas sp. SE-A7]MDM4768099.1 alkaline phosphatase D family protein [Pelomonas sp. SE-A7]